MDHAKTPWPKTVGKQEKNWSLAPDFQFLILMLALIKKIHGKFKNRISRKSVKRGGNITKGGAVKEVHCLNRDEQKVQRKSNTSDAHVTDGRRG